MATEKNTQWLGLISNADPHDIPAGGAVIQENFACLTPGRLTGRKGLRSVMFSNADGEVNAPTDPVIAIGSMETPLGQMVVMLLEDGTVRYGRRPL